MAIFYSPLPTAIMITQRAAFILPFAAKQVPLGDKGRTEVGHVTARSGLFFLPFKGRTEVGMGVSRESDHFTHPHPSLPLEGEGDCSTSRTGTK